MAKKGGRTYVSQAELSVIESIKKEKQQILDLEKKELQNIKALKNKQGQPQENVGRIFTDIDLF